MKESPYREQLRVRVSGLLTRGVSLLLVKLKSPVLQRSVWMPPGGGLKYGESIEECLIREFKEETGMEIKVGLLLHVNELMEPPYHAVEFYFKVTEIGGGDDPELGFDPEQADKAQILEDIQFIPVDKFGKFEILPTYLKEEFRKGFQAGNLNFTSSLRKR